MVRYIGVMFMFALVSVFGVSAAAETAPEIEIQASKELAEEIRAQLDEQAIESGKVILTPLDQLEVDDDHGEVPPAAPEQDESFEDSDSFDSEPTEAMDPEDLLVDSEDSDGEAKSDVAAPGKEQEPAVEPKKPDYDNGVEPDSDAEAQDPDSEIETRDPDEDEEPAAIDEDEESAAIDDEEEPGAIDEDGGIEADDEDE